MCLSMEGICVTSINTNFIHRLYDYSHLPEDTFGQRLKKLRLMKGLSQYNLSTVTNVKRSLISSYEIEQFYPTLNTIKNLGTALNINILCKSGYSYFLLHCDNFKDKLLKWRTENNLTKRDAANLLNISERGYSRWEEGVIMSATTYYKVEEKLKLYSLVN